MSDTKGPLRKTRGPTSSCRTERGKLSPGGGGPPGRFSLMKRQKASTAWLQTEDWFHRAALLFAVHNLPRGLTFNKSGACECGESTCERAHARICTRTRALKDSVTVNSPLADRATSTTQTTPSYKRDASKPQTHKRGSCSCLSTHPSSLETVPALRQRGSNQTWATKPVFQLVRPGSRDMSKSCPRPQKSKGGGQALCRGRRLKGTAVDVA